MLFWSYFSLGYTRNSEGVWQICLWYRCICDGKFYYNLVRCSNGSNFDSGATWASSNLANCQAEAKTVAFPLLKYGDHRLANRAVPFYVNLQGL